MVVVSGCTQQGNGRADLAQQTPDATVEMHQVQAALSAVAAAAAEHSSTKTTGTLSPSPVSASAVSGLQRSKPMATSITCQTLALSLERMRKAVMASPLADRVAAIFGCRTDKA
jgi:hypothetical protein